MKQPLRTLLIVALALFAQTAARAQHQFKKAVDWANLHEVKQTPDGGYIATGWCTDTVTYQDICLVKTTAAGDTSWVRVFREQNQTIAFSVATASDGYLVGGNIYEDSLDGGNIYLIKTTLAGDTAWTKKIGGSGTDNVRNIRATPDNGYLLAGITNSYGAGDMDAYLLKLSANGDVEWTRTYGSAGRDYCYAVLPTSDSGYVALVTLNAFTLDSDLALIKLNAQGDTLWTRAYDNAGAMEYGFGIVETPAGGFAVAGHTTAGDGSALLMVTDNSGNLVWAKTYGGSGYEWGNSLSSTNDNGYAIAGHSNSFGDSAGAHIAPFLMRLTAYGDTLWTKSYPEASGSPGIAHSAAQTTDGGFIVAGMGTELMKTNAQGDPGCLVNQARPVITSVAITEYMPALAVTSPPAVVQPTLTTVSQGLEVYDECVFVVGLEESAASPALQLSVYPNPANAVFLVEIENAGSVNAKIELYTLLGQRVYSNSTNTASQTIDSSSFPEGIYLLKVAAGNQQTTAKLVISR